MHSLSSDPVAAAAAVVVVVTGWMDVGHYIVVPLDAPLYRMMMMWMHAGNRAQ